MGPHREEHLLHHTRPRVEDSDLDDSQSERVVRGVGTDKGLSRKKLPHSAAEEEEESTDNSDGLRVVSMTQHRSRVAQSSTHGEDDPCPFTDDLQSGAEMDSNVPEGWHTGTPAPTPGQTPTVLSRHPSEESEVPTVLKSTDQASGLWRNKGALSKVLVKLAEKCRDSQLDLTLRGRLTGMKGVLNIYLDPKLNYSWTGASLMVAKVEGHGVDRARKL